MKVFVLFLVIVFVVAGVCFKKSMDAAQKKDNCRNLIEVYAKQIKKDMHKKENSLSSVVSEEWSWKVPATLEELRKAGEPGGRLADVKDDLEHVMRKMKGDFNPDCKFVPVKEASNQAFYTVPANRPVMQCQYHLGHTILERDLE